MCIRDRSILLVRVNEEKAAAVAGEKAGDIFAGLTEGIKFLGKNLSILFVTRRVFIMMISVGFFYVSLTGMFLEHILAETGLSIAPIKGLGFMQGVLGFGLVAGFVISGKAEKSLGAFTLIRILFPLLGAFIAGIYFFRNYYFLLFIAFAAGAAGAIILGLAETVIQKNSPENMRGRMFAAYYILRNLSLVIATSSAGFIARLIREPEIILMSGLLLFGYGMVNVFGGQFKKAGVNDDGGNKAPAL